MPNKHVNTAEIWAALSPEIQAQIGAAAIANELAQQGCTSDDVDFAIVTAFERTSNETGGELSDLITLHCPTAFLESGEPRQPDLNAIGIRQCTTCGCTDNYGCAAGCCWTGPTTCSQCAPAPTPETPDAA